MIKNFLKNHHIHHKIVPYFDDFFICNPTLFFTIWFMISIGMYLAHQNILMNPQWVTSEINFKIILLFISLTFLTGATFIKGQLISLDLNNKNTLLIKFVNKQRATNILKLSIIIGTCILLFTNIYNIVLSVLVYLILDYYFTNKYQDSRKKYINYILIFFISILLILNGYAIVLSDGSYFFSLLNAFNFLNFLSIIFYSFMGLSIFIMIEIVESGDNKIIFRFYASLIMLIVFIFSIYVNDPLLSVTSICCLPFLLYALFRNFNKDLVRSVRYSIFICNFFIFTIYPWIAIPLILIFYISKYYYWHRLDIHFPTFLVEND